MAAATKPFVDAYKPAGFVDATDPGYKPPADAPPIDLTAPLGEEGFFGGVKELGRGVARGAMVTVPEQVGGALQFFGAEETGKAVSEFGERMKPYAPQESVISQVARQDPLSIRGGAGAAGENLPLSFGPMAAGALAGLPFGPVGAAVGAGIGMASALPIFYGGQAQETFKKVEEAQLKAGKTPEQAREAARTAGHLAGSIEAGGELVADVVPLGAMLKPFAKPVVGAAVKSLFAAPVKGALKTLGKTEVAEIATEMGQQAGEAQVEGLYGAGPGATWKDTASVIMPTAIMSLFPGALAGGHNIYSIKKAESVLADPAADPEARKAAAGMVMKSLGDENIKTGVAFGIYANDKIASGEPVEITDDAVYLAYDTAQQQARLAELTPDNVARTNTYLDGIRRQEEFEANRQETLQRTGIDPATGVVGAAAATAVDTGAAGQAAAARQTEADQAGHEGAVEAAAAAAKPGEEPAEVTPPEPPFSKVPPKLFPFSTPEGALSRIKFLQAQTGVEHVVVPHPTVHDAFAVVPKPTEVPSAVQEPSTEGVGPYPGGAEGVGGPVEGGGVGPGIQGPEVTGEGQVLGPETGVQQPGQGPVTEGEPSGETPVLGEDEGIPPDTGDAEGPGAVTGPVPAGGEGEGGPAGPGPITGGPSTPEGPAPPVPTGPQIDAGNYQKDHLKVGPLDISVENRESTERSNLREADLTAIADAIPAEARVGRAQVAHQRLLQAVEMMRSGDRAVALQLAKQAANNLAMADPQVAQLGRQLAEQLQTKWAATIKGAHYGYIKGTKGRDKEHVDTFVKPGTPETHAGPVFVIDQVDAAGAFDEHKVMIGYDSKLAAIGAYKANYPKEFKVGAVHETTMEEFEAWARDPKQTQLPFADRTPPVGPVTPPGAAPTPPVSPPIGPETPPPTTPEGEGGVEKGTPKPPEGEPTPAPGPATPPGPAPGPEVETPKPPEGEPTPPAPKPEPKPPKPPGETVTIAQAKKVWNALTLEEDEKALFEGATWRTLDGAPHVLGKEGAAYHFTRVDKQVLMVEGYVSDKARRRARGSEETAEDPIANMIADGDQEGLAKAIYNGLRAPGPKDWPQVFPEDSLIRIDVDVADQAGIESNLKALKFRVTGREMSDERPGKIRLSALYRPEKGGIIDVGGTMAGGRKEGPQVDPGDPTDPDEARVDKLLASIGKSQHSDPHEGFGSFGSFMFREAMLNEVTGPAAFVAKPFLGYNTQNKPRRALVDAVKAGKMDAIVARAKLYTERLRLLSDVMYPASTVASVAQELRAMYQEKDQDGNFQQIVNPGHGTDLARVLPGDIPAIINRFETLYGADEESTDQTDRAVKKDPTVPPRLETIVRKNMQDHRGGKNIDAEADFKDVFGFRGVEFGNWVNQTERQENLNLAFDGLWDMVDALKADPKLIGLADQLGLAFGARGRGRASAHFEPSNNVINLTRHKGNGTVSHEWMHALEHDLRRTNQGRELTDSLRTTLKKRLLPEQIEIKVRALLRSENEAPSERNVPPKEAALKYLMEEKWLTSDYNKAEKATDFKYNADALDQGRAEAYWGTAHELVARGYETFMFDTLKGGSPYLVGPTVADGYVTPANGYGGTTYPLGKEREYIADQYRQMLSQLNLATLEVNTYAPVAELREDALGNFHVFDQMGGKYGGAMKKEVAERRMADVNRAPVSNHVFGPREAQEAEARKAAWDVAQRLDKIMDELGIHDYPEEKNGSMSESMFYHLRNGWWPKDNNALKDFAKQAKRVEALDNLGLKQAQEDFEAALAKYVAQRITDLRLDGGSDRAIYDYVVDLYSRQPNLDVRTTTSMANQGYSTPLPISFVSALLARVKPTETGYDPTAGNGLLMIAGNPQHLILNELEHHRAENLKLMKYGTVHKGDAVTAADRGVFKAQEADFVLMNPPFGALEKEELVDGYRIRAIDQLIVAKNLAALKDDGRGVLILGANKVPGLLAAKDVPFLNWLYSNYNVADHFEIDGKLYSRQGASWPIRVLVLAGRQQSDKLAPATGTVDRVSTFDDLWGRYVQARGRSEQVLVGSVRQPGGAGSPDHGRGGVSKGGKGQAPVAGGEGGIEAGDDIIGGLFGPGDEVPAPSGRGRTGGGDLVEPAGGGTADVGRPGGGGAGGRGRGEKRGGAAKGPVAGDLPSGDRSLADLTDDDLDALFGDSPPPTTPEPPAPPKGGKKKGPKAPPAAPKVKFTPGAPAEVITPPAVIEAEFADVDPWQSAAEDIAKARPFFSFLRIDPADGAWNLGPMRTLRFSFYREQPSGAPKFLPTARGGDFLMLHGVEDRSSNTYTPINQTYQLGAKGLTGPVEAVSAEAAGDKEIDAAFEKFSLDGGPEIDNQLYLKVKPGFQQKWDSLMQKFGEIRVVIAKFLDYLVTKYGEKIKLYAKQFALEMRAKAREDELNRTKKRPIVEPDVPNELQSVYETRSGAPISGIYGPASTAKDQNAAFNTLENEYVSEYPGGIDEMVQKELGYDSVEEMWWGKGKDPDAAKGLAAYQVDAIALAIARMKEGLGFINGDDTGVGKGRQAAALIHWAVKNGKIPIFFTVKPDLFSDINRDLNDIEKPVSFAMTNADVDVTDDDDNVLVKRQGATKAKALTDHIIANRALPDGVDALFTTYDQIKEENDRRKAIRNLVASGKAVIIMDEAHTASGAAAPMFIEMLTGQGLENHVSLADNWAPPPTTYFSATFAKRPDNLPVYTRTHIGLIGQTPDDMEMVFSSGGPLLQQVVSKMLVRSGQMIRRERSYANLKLDWKVDEANGPRDFRLFDQVTSVLRSVVNADRAFNELMKQGDWAANFVQELIAAGIMPAGATQGMRAGDIGRGLDKQAYTSVVHNYLGQLLLATKLDASVKETVDAFNRGEKPVLALHNTMEAMLEDFTDTYKINHGDSLKNFGWNSVAQRGLNSTLRLKFKNPQGFRITIDQPQTILAMLPKIVQDEYRRAKQMIDALKSPLSAAPIDMLRHQLAQYRVFKDEQGREQMALPADVPAGKVSRPFVPQEITGRSLSVDYSTAEPTLSTRLKMKKRTVINAFNNGGVKDKKTGEMTYVDAVILNSSGSTGISLHASVKFDDQRPRRMLVLQPSPDISIFKQTIGRINRTGQVEYPFYTVFSSAVPAEKRPLAMLRKKMKSLTSNTSSQSKNAADVDATDFINMYGDRVVAQYLREHTEVKEFIGLDIPSDDDNLPSDLAMTASGRAALLPIREQGEMYDEVEQNYAELIATLNREGTNRLERAHYDYDAVPKELTEFFAGNDTTGNYPLDGGADIGLYDVNIIGVPPTPKQVKDEIATSLNGRSPEEVVNQIDSDLTLGYEEARNQLVIKIADLEKQLGGQQLTHKEREDVNRRLAATQRDLAQFSDRREQTLRALKREYSIGDGGLIRYSDFEPYAVVTGYTVHKRPTGNPFSPSNISVHFLRNIPNGPLTLRLSQLERNHNFKAYGWTDSPNIDHEFRDRNLSGGREEKYIITGNIPQALSQTQGVGEIMTFSVRDKMDGDETGLLMPRGFQPGNLATIDYNIRDPKQITDFLTGVSHALAVRDNTYAKASWEAFRGTADVPNIGAEQAYALAVFSKNRVVSLLPSAYHDVRIVIEGKAGAKFKKDKKLAALVGRDLTSKGGSMRADIPKERLAGVVRYLRNQMPLYVLNSVGELAKTFRQQPQAPQAKLSIGQLPFTKKSSVGEVQQAIQPLMRKWRNAPRIHVVQSVSQLPGGPKPAATRGVFNSASNTVYLVADNTAPDKAQFVLAHEVLGHFGLAGILGDQLDPMMDYIYRTNPAVRRMADARIRDAATKGRKYSTTLGTEEALADLAGQNRLREVNGWRMLVAAIRRALREIGFDIDFSENDIIALLARARGYVQAPSQAAAQPKPRFAGMVPLAADTGMLSTGDDMAKLTQLLDRQRRILTGVEKLEGDAKYAALRDIALQLAALQRGERLSLGDMVDTATQAFSDALRSPRKLNPLLKGFQTQFHKAQKHAGFREVFQETQAYLRDISSFATSAADLATGLLPKLGRASDLKPKWMGGVGRAAPKDVEAVSRATFAATLADMRPTKEQLLAGFTAQIQYGKTLADIEVPPLTKTQADLFLQARLAIDRSIDQTAVSQMSQLATGYGIGDVLAAAKDNPDTGATLITAALEEKLENAKVRGDKPAVAQLQADMEKIEKVAAEALQLQDSGYAPLMRFGQYTLKVEEVVEGVPTIQFFGMFENKRELYAMEREMKQQYPKAVVTPGTLDRAAFQLFQGLNLSAIETFAKVTGLKEDEAFQAYYRMAVASRSALKHLIHRKGIAGYSEDLPRVLASFITSSARLASKNYHFAAMNEGVFDIPQEEGDVRTEAAELVKYVQNPMEEAPKLRGLLFVNFIGGSIASALTNLTQTTLMTAPWLSQFSNPAAAAAKVVAAMKLGSSIPTDKDLRAALKRAELEGITDPQEIHQLYAESIRGIGSSLWARKGLRVWGSMFSLAESFNRRVTFTAAFQTAQAPGGLARINAARAQRGEAQFKDAYDFAEYAVEATQGIYNRGNRPNYARGPIGATIFTFKQFTIAYLEFLSRLPAREKVVAASLLMLATGLQGAPGADDLEDLIDTIGQLMGYNTNSKKFLREKAAEHLGDTFGGLLTHGVSTSLPFDVQGRLSFSNIIPGTALFKQSDVSHRAAEIAEVAGPLGGLYKQGTAGFEALVAGNVTGLLSSAFPVAVQNAMKGLDMWTSGSYKDARGGKIIDVDNTDAMFKFIGIQPENVAARQRVEGDVMQSVALVRVKESAIADQWARAILDKDEAGIREAVRQLHEWNTRNPEWPIQITPYQIRQRVQSKMLERGARILKAAPKEVRATVQRELQ